MQTLKEMLCESGFCGAKEIGIFLRLDSETNIFVSQWGDYISAGETEDEAVAAVISARIMSLEAQVACYHKAA